MSTPLELQKELKKEMESLFKGFKLKNIDGESSELKVYRQNLPAKAGQDDKDHFPHIRVIITDGEDPSPTGANTCRVMFIAGTWDDSDDMQGFDDVMNIMQKIYEHLIRTVLSRFTLEYPIRWSPHDEDTFPYFFAGMETVWTIGKITPPDSDLT